MGRTGEEGLVSCGAVEARSEVVIFEYGGYYWWGLGVTKRYVGVGVGEIEVPRLAVLDVGEGNGQLG